MSQSSIAGFPKKLHSAALAISPPLIAVLDDEACIRIAFERLLRSAGFRVKGYSLAADFLNAIAAEPPAALVLDIHMPEIDGFDVLAALKSGGIRLPVVIVSAEDAPAARERAMAAGAVLYLVKPVNDSDLIDGLAIAMAHAQAPGR